MLSSIQKLKSEAEVTLEVCFLGSAVCKCLNLDVQVSTLKIKLIEIVKIWENQREVGGNVQMNLTLRTNDTVSRRRNFMSFFFFLIVYFACHTYSFAFLFFSFLFFSFSFSFFFCSSTFRCNLSVIFCIRYIRSSISRAIHSLYSSRFV